MSKFSRVSLARKKELEKPDEFLIFSKRLIEAALKYQKELFTAAGAILIIFFVVIGFLYYSDVNEEKAFKKLNDIMTEYGSLLKGDDPQKAFKAANKDFEALIQTYPGTVAGGLGRIHYGDICYRTGNYEKAITLLESALDDFDEPSSFRNLIVNGLGHSHAAKNNTKEAVKYFKLIADGSSPVLKDEALFNLGRLYAEAGEKDKSVAAYKKLAENFEDSIYVDIIKEKISGS